MERLLGEPSVLFLACFARTLGCCWEWQDRKQAIIDQHPLYGRIVKTSELPYLVGITKEAWRFPRVGPAAMDHTTRSWRVVYLVQGEDDASEKTKAMWQGGSDVFVLTFRSRRPDTIYFPNSLLAEGRNVLLAAAIIQEARDGQVYNYYVLADADGEALPSWNQALPRFEAFLREWQPAVGLPKLGGSIGRSEDPPESVTNFDHIFTAVHSDAVASLLPYDTSYDHLCAWTSQWQFTLLAAALFRNHVLVIPSVIVLNPTHSSYPKENCWAQMINASARLRTVAPAVAHDCFPDPLNSMLVLPDRIAHSFYIPWGSARPKENNASEINYRNVSFRQLSSCRDETAIRAMQRSSEPSPAVWCYGCSIEEAFTILQGITAEDPYKASNWNMLGVWMRQLGDWRWWPAAGLCFKISSRLRELQGLSPHDAVAQNLVDISIALSSIGVSSDLRVSWTAESTHALQMTIFAALQIDVGAERRPLLFGVRLEQLLDYLTNRTS